MFPQEMKNHVHTKMVYIGFIGHQKHLRNNLNVPRLGNGQTVVYPYNGIPFSNKKNKLLIPTTAWSNLKCIMLNEKKQSPEPHTLFMYIVERQNHGVDNRSIGGCQGPREGGGVNYKGHRVNRGETEVS